MRVAVLLLAVGLLGLAPPASAIPFKPPADIWCGGGISSDPTQPCGAHVIKCGDEPEFRLAKCVEAVRAALECIHAPDFVECVTGRPPVGLE